MGQREDQRIEQDLLDEPHIAGRRISVRQIAAKVEEVGVAPAHLAADLDLAVADVYHALAYYHDHPEEMQAVEDRRERQQEAAREAARQHAPDHVDVYD